MPSFEQAVVKMRVLLVSMFFQKFEQALPFFFEHIEVMNHRPEKMIFFDFLPEQKFSIQTLGKNVFVEKKVFEQDFAKQLSGLRNSALETARKEQFDAVLFLQPNIFPPPDLIEALEKTGKHIIAPAFFTSEQGTVFSNAVKITGQGIQHVLFNGLLPSGVKKVDSVSLQVLFLSGRALEKISFDPVQDSVSEMLSLARKAQELGMEIFLDSSTVCGKLSQLQLVSHYYFKAQNALEPNSK